MKFLIASDIHGSAYFCNLLIKAIKEEKADKVLLLGDALYHGPRNDLPEGHNPKGVIALLNGMAEEILCVRGNCEAEVDDMVLDFNVLADYAILYHGEKLFFQFLFYIINNLLPPFCCLDRVHLKHSTQSIPTLNCMLPLRITDNHCQAIYPLVYLSEIILVKMFLKVVIIVRWILKVSVEPV